jgi:hypothetical protein
MSVFTYQESSGGTRSADVRRQGVGSMGSAVTRRFFRNTPDYVKTPGSPLYTLVPAGTEAMAEGGIPCHNALTAYQPYSSLYPAGGWTLTNGSGSAAYDTTIYMFDESIQPLGPRSIKLVGGAAAAPTAMAPVSLNMATLTTLRLRVWARQEATSDLEWALYSSRAAKWWDPAAGTFSSAAAVWTDVGHSTGDTTDFVMHEFVIDKGATVSPDTLQVTYRQNANGKTGYVGTSDFVAVFNDTVGFQGYPSGPPFPQDAVAVAGTRTTPIVRLHQESGLLMPDAGTIFLTVVPDFSGLMSFYVPIIHFGSLSSLVSGTMILFLDPSVAPPTIWVYENISGLLVGHSYPITWPADATWRLAIVYSGSTRYLSDPGALKLQVYLQGVLLGTENLAAELFSVNPCKDAWIGSGDNVIPGCFSGYIRDLAFSPYIWTPAQIAARAAL